MTDLIHFALALEAAPPEDSAPVWGKVAVADVPQALQDRHLTWVHLDAAHPDLPAWLETNLPAMDETVLDALTQSETRPWAGRLGDDLLVVFRAVNLNEGKDREDMLGIRIWVEQTRIITLSRAPIRALQEIAAESLAGRGPSAPGAFLALLGERLADHLEPFISDLDLEVDGLEAEVIDAPHRDLRRRIVRLRLSLVELRRHLPPQRDALGTLQICNSPLLTRRDLREILRSHDRLTRLNENVDELRDNLVVLRDELSGQLSDRINQHMYALSIISVLFLPLTFLTGLFGINVGGIPGANTDSAFVIFAGVMLAVFAVQLWLLRRMRWI